MVCVLPESQCGLPNSSAPLLITPSPSRSRTSQASSLPAVVHDSLSGVLSPLKSKDTPPALSVRSNPSPETSTRMGEVGSQGPAHPQATRARFACQEAALGVVLARLWHEFGFTVALRNEGRTINHPCCHGYCFLVDLIIAEYFHLAAEQLRCAAISYRQYSTPLHAWS